MQRERPFELSQKELEARIEEMVDATFADISSEFLLMPTGTGLVSYPDFQAAYEVLKRKTRGFQKLSLETVKTALLENSLVLGVLRAVLGMTAPEWAELARVCVPVNLDRRRCRTLIAGGERFSFSECFALVMICTCPPQNGQTHLYCEDFRNKGDGST